MTKVLIIAEKPSVANDIAMALGGFRRVNDWLEGDDAVISSGVGHLVEIYAPEAEATGKDLASLPVIPQRFHLRTIEKTKDRYALLERLLHRDDVSTVINACDAGREGELIFRLIYEKAQCRKPVRRMWLQSMTHDAIRDAYKTLRDSREFDDLGAAARCRAESDWLMGINGSRGVTKLRERQTQRAEISPVGRVQTPTLTILVEQELKIRNFVPEDYWEVHATIAVNAGSYGARWFNTQQANDDEKGLASRFMVKAKADAIAAKCRGVDPSSIADTATAESKGAPKLFDLTTLQREANKGYKFSAKRTLEIAQALYEKHKATTYPRTDSNALPEDYVGKTAGLMKALAGTPYEALSTKVVQNGWINKQGKRIFDNSKISDHFAIIPTGQKPQGLSADESKIYDMIVRRFIAAFYPAAEYLQTVRITIISGEHFKSSGKVLMQPGWLEVYGVALSDDPKTPKLCVLVPGEPATTRSVDVKGLKTRAPARFTEATLLSAMENAGNLVVEEELREAMKKKGLGTPATRASIIEGLLSAEDALGRKKEPYAYRDTTSQDKKSGPVIIPTEKGIQLIQFLMQHQVDSLTSPRMTGDWEQKLRQMEAGSYQRSAFMEEIAEMTRHLIALLKAKAAEVVLPPEAIVTAPCPSCGGSLEASPRTVNCQANCGFTLWLEVAGRKLSVKEADLLIRDRQLPKIDGFYSPKKKRNFSAILKLDDDFKVVMEFDNNQQGGSPAPDGNTVQCPTCSKPMRRIPGKNGHFWGCTGYTDGCRTTMDDRNGKPVPKSTPQNNTSASSVFL